jgi:hypothetical protein
VNGTKHFNEQGMTVGVNCRNYANFVGRRFRGKELGARAGNAAEFC